MLRCVLPSLLVAAAAATDDGSGSGGPRAQMVLDLGGAGWTVRSSNGSVSAPSTVPGVVHTDLLSAGIIPEPFAEYNELALRWVALENWTFSRMFSFDGTASGSSTLVFDGLDTYADITLNNHSMGSSSNAFLRLELPVPVGLLRSGDNANELSVRFTNPQAVGQTAAADYPVPLREFRANRYSYSGRPFVRKSQTHFGWNWGPGFITSGIYRGVRLSTVVRGTGSVDSVLVQQHDGGGDADADAGSSPENASATVWPPLPHPAPTVINISLGVEVRCASASTETIMVVEATLAGSARTEGKVTCPADDGGGTLVTATLALSVAVGPSDGVSLWYPNGYGEQSLHNLSVTLCTTSAVTSSGRAAACAVPWSKAIGLRVVELVQEPLPWTKAVNSSLGPSRSFYFRVNGLPVFAKGANNIPSDQFESRVTPALLWDYLSSAKAAHFTALRVWGGGLYERDEFFEYCDKLGIMLYHDMMFSDQIYPWHTPFLESVAAETKYQVRRLSHHPSLVLWSGTNELLPGAVTNLAPFTDYVGNRPDQWAPSGGNQIAGSVIYTLGVQKLHFEAAGQTLRSEDTSRPFVPSSPSNGWLSEEMLIPEMCIHQANVNLGCAEAPAICNPSNPARGDAHYYTLDPSVAFNASAMLPPAKFVSENGVESYASLKPLSTVTSAADRWIGSEQTAFRERAGKDQYSGWGLGQLRWVAYHFGNASLAKGNTTAGFPDFIVLSQLAAGLGLRGMAEQFRLQKRSAEDGGTMGHLIWQLQDNWPGQSFGLLNYGGEWKQQLHFVRRSFAPLLITAAGPLDSPTQTIHLISDIPRYLHGCEVEAMLWELGGATTPTQTWNATVAEVAPGGVAQALTLPADAVRPRSGAFLRLRASCDEGNMTSSNDHYFSAGSENFAAARRLLQEPPGCVASDWALAGSSCAFSLRCEKVALFVVLDTTGSLGPGRFSDGAFAMVPGEEKRLLFSPAGHGKVCDVEAAKGKLVISSLYSLMD